MELEEDQLKIEKQIESTNVKIYRTAECWNCSQTYLLKNKLSLDCSFHPGQPKPLAHSENELIYVYDCCGKTSQSIPCSLTVHSTDKEHFCHNLGKKFYLMREKEFSDDMRLPGTAIEIKEQEMDDLFLYSHKIYNDKSFRFIPRDELDLDKKTEKKINHLDLKIRLQKTNATECFSYEEDVDNFEKEMGDQKWWLIPLTSNYELIYLGENGQDSH